MLKNWLKPADAKDADTTVRALMMWFKNFGVVPIWCSDRDFHFKNDVIHKLNQKLRARYHLTTAHCPHSNRKVESICREVLRAYQSLLSELQRKTSEWPVMLPLVQRVLNHSMQSSLGRGAPITAFCGLTGDNPLQTIIHPRMKTANSAGLVTAR